MEGEQTASDLISQATDLPSLLDAAWQVFEHILASLRAAEEDAGPLLAALVMAAAAAADGRDAIGTAPALPSAASPLPLPAAPGSPDSTADQAASLARLLQDRLAAAPDGSTADQAAITSAIGCARRIGELLGAADAR
jgi:hypothetical protein